MIFPIVSLVVSLVCSPGFAQTTQAKKNVLLPFLGSLVQYAGCEPLEFVDGCVYAIRVRARLPGDHDITKR